MQRSTKEFFKKRDQCQRYALNIYLSGGPSTLFLAHGFSHSRG